MTVDVSSERVADDLYRLSEALGRRSPDRQADGLLGGEWGYGQDYENDVFEMHPFWWGDCECGYDDREQAWEDSHPHASACYQAALLALGRMPPGDERGPALAAAWGLPHQGWGVHCTCGREESRQAWLDRNPHPGDCPMVRPNFRHKASGVEVRWYKYIGRSMDGPNVATDVWQSLVDECLASVPPPLAVVSPNRS